MLLLRSASDGLEVVRLDEDGVLPHHVLRLDDVDTAGRVPPFLLAFLIVADLSTALGRLLVPLFAAFPPHIMNSKSAQWELLRSLAVDRPVAQESEARQEDERET